MFLVIQRSQMFFAGVAIVILLLSIGMYNFAAPQAPVALDKNVIVIDAGHGGMDGGAVGVTGLLEKDVNLSVAKYLEELAKADGKTVIMTREADESLHTTNSSVVREQKRSDLKKRREILQQNQNGIFVSIHMNKFDQASVKGAQVFYAGNDQSRILAQNIQDSLRVGIGDGNNRVAKEAPSSLFIFKGCTSCAVVVECGFVSNPEEEKLLATEDYQRKLAKCIYDGICK